MSLDQGLFFFVNSLETWKMLSAADTVFSSSPVQEVASAFPGWVMTGNRVNGYHEWKLVIPQKAPVPPRRPVPLLTFDSLRLRRGVGDLFCDQSVPSFPYVVRGKGRRRVLRHPEWTYPKKGWRVLSEKMEFWIPDDGLISRLELESLVVHQWDKGRKGKWKVCLEDEEGDSVLMIPQYGVVFASITGSYSPPRQPMSIAQKGKGKRVAVSTEVEEISRFWGD